MQNVLNIFGTFKLLKFNKKILKSIIRSMCKTLRKEPTVANFVKLSKFLVFQGSSRGG